MTIRPKNTTAQVIAAISILGVTMPAAAFVSPIPEPNTLLLLVAGVAAVFLAGKISGRK